MAEITSVVFDYYETLAELSLPIRERFFDDLARRLGVDLLPGEGYRHWRELTTSDLKLRLGGQRAPLDGSPPPFRTFRHVWLERSRELFQQWGVNTPAEVGADACAGLHAGAIVYPEVPDMLEELRSRHRLAVLSDADGDFLESSVRRNGLTFDAVIASDELRAYKPHVSLFREVCGRLGVQPSQVAFVGDSPWADIEGARHAGMWAIWVNRHGVSWPEEIAPPPAVVISLGELAELIERGTFA